MADDSIDEAVDALYALPRTEFTAARDALARRLKRDGQPDQAEAVRALRKPSVIAASANAAVRSDPEAVLALLDAGAEAASVQDAAASGDADGDELRTATRALKEAVDAMVAVAARVATLRGRGDVELSETFRAAALDEPGRELLQRGRFTDAVSAAGFEGVAVSDSDLGRADELRAARERKAAAWEKLQREAEEAEAEAARLEEEAGEAEDDARRARRSADAAAMRAEDLRRRADETPPR